MTQPMLSCRGVDVCYGPVQVLFGVDLEIAAGEIVALLGTNGAGKSTLLKAVSGLVAPTAGTITLDGRDITGASATDIARLGVVQVPGGRAVFPSLTVAEHFRAAEWAFRRAERGDVRARTEELLDILPRVRDRWDLRAGNLSGGEQQQLALAMAFVARPRLLIIDELSLGLAPSIVAQLLGMVRDIQSRGCTVVLVEQSVNVALTLAERAYFLEKGEVRFSGATAELLERDDVLRSVFLRTVATPGSAISPPHRPSESPALTVAGLTKSFGGITAVRDVSLSLDPGQVLGLIGPNGSGKTTVFDLISGLLVPDGGEVRLGGVDVTRWSAHRRAMRGLGRSFQDARLFPSLTVRENIALGLERHLSHRDPLASLLGLPMVLAEERDVAFTVEDLIELMHLSAYRDKFVGELSTGTRRIVDLAMAIAHAPDVLLLDEPSSGLAQRETEALGPLLRNLRVQTSCAMLVIEHDMTLICEVSDELVALELGEVVCQGPAADVLADTRVVAAYLGENSDAVHRSGARPAVPA